MQIYHIVYVAIYIVLSFKGMCGALKYLSHRPNTLYYATALFQYLSLGLGQGGAMLVKEFKLGDPNPNIEI